MTGIDRLRALAGAWDEWGLGGALAEIADEIEREHVSRIRVMAVLSEMERHVSGVEGAEDSPVARWARELREALGGGETDEDRDAIAWVREHGGLGRVKDLLDWVVGHCSTKQQLDFDFWLSGRVMHELGFEEDMADRDEVERRLLARLMPEGMEWLVEAWPRFEDDAPVRFSDDFDRYGDENGVSAVTMYSDGSFALNCRAYSKGERVKRPAPKVLDADGEECRIGDAVWWVKNGVGNFRIIRIEPDGKCAIRDDDPDEPCGMTVPSTELTHKLPVLDADGVEIRVGDTVYLPDGTPVHVTAIGDVKAGQETVFGKAGSDITDDEWQAVLLTHQRPVLDADGVPLEVGQTVYDVDAETDTPMTVVEVSSDLVRCEYTWKDGKTYRPCCPPDQLTHTKPEPPDSRRAIVNEIGDEMAARIDLLVSSGRWSDAD